MSDYTSFKQYRRGSRVLDTDLIYSGGMQYTLKPLTKGYNRRLLNYDLIDSGASVKSRPGLKIQDQVLLEAVPANGNLVLQAGASDALYDYNGTQWKANSIVGLGDTLEPVLRVWVSSSGIEWLQPGHLYLIGNPATDGPTGYTNLGKPANTIPCFKLGNLFHTSPFYDEILLKNEVRDSTPLGKNYLYISGFLEYGVIPSTLPGVTISVNKETQEITIDGTAATAFSLHLGYWRNRPNEAGILRVNLNGTYTGSPTVTWGQYNAFHSGNAVNTDLIIPQISPDPGWDYGEVFLNVLSGTVFNNVTIHTQMELGTVSTEWEAYQPGAITTPATYAKINNISFTDNYWMQHSPCGYGFDGKFFYFISKIIQDPTMSPSTWPLLKTYLMLSNGGRGTNLYDNWDFSTDMVTPKALNPSEAGSWGYNMLSDNPYTFANGTSGSVITLTGILPYNAAGTQIELNPKINQTIMLECFYSAATPTNYNIKFQWKDLVSANWTTIATVAPSSGHFRCTFTNPSKEILIRATAIKLSDSSEEAVIATGFNFSATTQSDVYANYDLTQCKYLLYHNRRLCFYGLPGNENLIFFSDYSDVSYVPYPNNMLEFDSAVKKVVEYQQNWLVFTTNSIYSVTLESDGLTWDQELIQTGLEITDVNALFIVAIKSFVIFKSGNYIYMVVPSSSVAGSLTIAPIYLTIKELLDDLNAFFVETLKELYNYTDSFSLVRFQPYITLDDIHLVFSIILSDGAWLNIDLIYNTLIRTWKVYVFETPAMFLPYVKDITQGPQLITENPEDPTQLRSYQFDSSTENINDDMATLYNNIQLLDTGYRDLSIDLKKRFREFQYTIYVTEPSVMQFSTQFYIDSILRKQISVMQGELQEDPTQEGRYLLFITDDPIYDFLPNILAPDDPLVPEGYWELDLSGFDTIETLKVRQQVSGKGYMPRLVIKANNEISHELLHNTWVFRVLNAR